MKDRLAAAGVSWALFLGLVTASAAPLAVATPSRARDDPSAAPARTSEPGNGRLTAPAWVLWGGGSALCVAAAAALLRRARRRRGHR